MILDVFKLPDDSTRLKQIVIDLHASFAKETDIMLEQISLLRAQLFGHKSEKIKLKGPCVRIDVASSEQVLCGIKGA